MKTARSDRACYAMSRNNQPVLRAEQGESFQLETKDCYSNNLRSPDDVFTKEMWDTVNPATGPVYVEGVKPGEVLQVEIEGIEVRDYAVMCVEHGAGAMAEQIQGVETSILRIEKDLVHFDDGIDLLARPMVGVIGVAPEEGEVLNGTPGEHGGNMDCKLITAGARVFLPVSAPGALLAAGDIHAVMGDGEVCICGAEVAGTITLNAKAVSQRTPTPCVATETHLHFIASALTLDECERAVLGKAHTYLCSSARMDANKAARLMSLVGNLEVCQVVDPLKTMRFGIPNEVLKSLGLTV